MSNLTLRSVKVNLDVWDAAGDKAKGLGSNRNALVGEMLELWLSDRLRMVPVASASFPYERRPLGTPCNPALINLESPDPGDNP